MNPMIPFLSGWIAGCLDKKAQDAMKIVGIEIVHGMTIRVEFASGLKVDVNVMEKRP